MRRRSDGRPRDLRSATSVRDVPGGNPAPEVIGPAVPYDELTELPNQQSFHDHIARAIGSTRNRSRRRFAVLLIELDGFQAVNDTFGWAIAQKLLAVTARRLELCVGAEDIVARVGAHTFAILLPEIGTVSAADEAAERVTTLMHLPAFIGERVVHPTISVGIAIGNATHRRPHELLHEAGAAGRNARGAGRASSVDAQSRHGHGMPSGAHMNPRPRHEVEPSNVMSDKTFEVEREAGSRQAVGVL
jgi:diguanylate cyclase (GGDEF)-like protein